jgi:D-proline reductase (dithiol) PrdB
VSLVARTLEENGIATVVIGSAKDIVEHCGVPRFVFTDFPLGNPCGRPDDFESQQLIMTAALTILEEATIPGTTVQTPLAFDEHAKWKTDFMHVGDDNRAALRAAGDRRRAEQAAARA